MRRINRNIPRVKVPALNLNDALVRDEGDGRPLEDFGGWLEEDVEVYFRNLEERLIQKIEAADYVFGCVAWLTHPDIISALSKKKGVCIIVQKEDFLRPDIDARKGWASSLRKSLDALPGTYRGDYTSMHALSVCCEYDISAIRCVGNLNTDKSPAHPRSHHKFVVFANDSHCACESCNDGMSARPPGHLWTISSVWTGSFNFTKNAVHSLENAVVLRSRKVATAFFDEFQQIAALSEPLDWRTPWSAPQWRIGT